MAAQKSFPVAHPSRIYRKNAERNLVDVIEIIRSDLCWSFEDAIQLLLSLVEQHGLVILEQGRHVSNNAIITALCATLNAGSIENVELEIITEHRGPGKPNQILRRPFAKCTIFRDSMWTALNSFNKGAEEKFKIKTLPSWIGMEAIEHGQDSDKEISSLGSNDSAAAKIQEDADRLMDVWNLQGVWFDRTKVADELYKRPEYSSGYKLSTVTKRIRVRHKKPRKS